MLTEWLTNSVKSKLVFKVGDEKKFTGSFLPQFMTMKLSKMCPKYAYFCRKWPKKWSERPWGDFWLCPSKNMVNLGAFHCSKPIPPGAYTLSNWHVKKSIFVQFALFAACFHSAVADENGDNSGVLCPIMIKFCVVIDRDQDYAHTKF